MVMEVGGEKRQPKLSYDELLKGVDRIRERVETVENFTELFADANVYQSLIPLKHQVVTGRRGTGKTHILGRLKEHYRDNFASDRILPVYIDATKIAHVAVAVDPDPTTVLLIWFRR